MNGSIIKNPYASDGPYGYDGTGIDVSRGKPFQTPQSFSSTQSKPFKLGFMLGRFQHVHIGHEMLIRKASSVCDTLIVLVGSAQAKDTLRNPFDIATRLDLIGQIFVNDRNIIVSSIDDLTHEDDHSQEWSIFLLNRLMEVLDKNNIKQNPDLFIYGDDEERASWFKDENNFSKLIITRDAIDISATKLREYIVKNNRFKWRQYVNPILYDEFDLLRDRLLDIEEYKEMEKND
jgi:nicotinamide-nucleotide adenylyltransferase